MRRTGQVIAVTTTKQTFGLGDPQDLYTLCNDDGADAVYYRGADPSAFAGTNAVLLAAGANKLDAGEKITVKGGAYDFVCATGGAASCRVLYGNSSTSGPITANVSVSDIGNVNLLDSEGGSVIDPARNDTIGAASPTSWNVAGNTSATQDLQIGSLKHFRIWLTPGSTPVYFGFSGNATTGNAAMDASMGVMLFDFDTAPAHFHVYAAATCTINIIAW